MILRTIAALAMSFMIVDSAAAAAKIQRVVSPGGIEAWLVHETTVPIVAFEFAFRGGAAQDPADRPGVSSMLAGLLDEGAGDLDAAAFQERMESSAVELAFHSGRDAFEGSLRTLAEKQGEAFELLRLAVNEARLDAEPVERIRAQMLARIRRASTEPGSIAREAWNEAAFGKQHPYGRRPMGTEESVQAITRDDLDAWRSRVFARSNLVVAVVGAIDAETLAPALDRMFGALPADPRLTPVAPIEIHHLGETKVIDLAVPQTTIMFGRNSLMRHDPDYIPAVVMNHILGGGTFTSRLFTEVREKRGLAYSVYSYLDPMEYSAAFSGGLATRNDRAEQAVELIAADVRRFAEEGPTADELEKAKKFLTGSYALNFDSSSKIARGLKQIQLQRMPIDYIDKRNDMVRAVTVEDVRRAAKRVLGDGRLLTVMVGRPADMQAPAGETAAGTGGTDPSPAAAAGRAGKPIR